MVVLATKASILIYPKQEQRETQAIQYNTIIDYIIRSSRCKFMEEDNKRHLYITVTQQQQKLKSRQQRKNNKGNRKKENKGDKREEDGKRQQV